MTYSPSRSWFLFKAALLPPILLSMMAISQCEESDGDGDGWTASDGDCDDANASVHPGATELCDGVDNDCDGTVDNDRRWYFDADDDGYGITSNSTTACDPPEHYVASDDDCDDTDPAIHPDAAETCDLRDNDCDQAVDEGLQDHRWQDADLDGFGSETAVRCGEAEGYIAVRGDCNDTDPSVHPGAADTAADGLDQDCGGTDGADPHVGFSSGSAQTIQAALNDAAEAATIWVAAGTYLEHDIQFTGRTVSLKSVAGPTDTVIDASGLSRVMILDRGEMPDTEIDGFTLTGGYVTGSSGGALLVRDSSPSVRHCIFSGNTAVGPDSAAGEGGNGGGVYLENSASLFVQCEFTNNNVHVTTYEVCYDSGSCEDQWFGGYGGGMQIYLGDPQISNCSFLENQPDWGNRGGALHVLEASPQLTDTLFARNRLGIGAAVSVQNGSAGFSRCVFEKNFYDEGAGAGAGLIAEYSEIEIDQCRFSSNRAHSGGAIYATYSVLTVTNSTFNDNQAESLAGAVYLSNYLMPSSTFHHNLFVGNSVLGKGGALFLEMGPSSLSHNTIVGNSAKVGGGVFLYSYCEPVLSNNLITHNVGYNLYNDPAWPCSVTLTNNGLYSPSGPTHNLDSLDPSNRLEDPNYIYYTPNRDTQDDALHLKPSSPMHDAGASGTYDLDGSPAELGVYGGEVADTTWYLDLDLDGLYDGWEIRYGLDPSTADGDTDLDQDGMSNTLELESGTLPNQRDTDGDGAADGAEQAVGSDPSDWYQQPEGDSVASVVAQIPADFPSIQAAVDAVRSTGEIALVSGSYPGSTTINGKTVSIRGLGEPSETVLDGEGVATPVRAQWSTLALSALTITGGQGEYGGGIRLENVDGSMTDLVIRNNEAWAGAGIYADGGELEFMRINLHDNLADPYSGGGVAIIELNASISNSVFTGNTGKYGGGLDAIDSNIEMDHVYFQKNAAEIGAGMSLMGTPFTIGWLTAVDNAASDTGGAMYLNASSGTLQYSTLVGNRAQTGAGGLYAYGNTTELIEVRNTIIAYSLGYNVASMYPLEISEGSPRVTLEYSNLYAAEGEENHNLPTLDETTTTVEPGFLTYEADLPLDLHLSLESPLVNAGDPALTDPDGSRADPGAFGGPGGASWDVDLDGLMDYFWPGTLEDAPSGFDPTQFDANDLDPTVQ